MKSRIVLTLTWTDGYFNLNWNGVDQAENGSSRKSTSRVDAECLQILIIIKSSNRLDPDGTYIADAVVQAPIRSRIKTSTEWLPYDLLFSVAGLQ